MLNKKKIEVIDKSLAKQQEGINKSQEQISILKNELKKLKSSNKELKASMDKILDTLEGKNFSKEWEEYQKYKKMKDKLPDIEAMYNLYELKRLIDSKSQHTNIRNLQYTHWVSAAYNPNPNVRNNLSVNVLTTDTTIDKIDKDIRTIIKELNSKTDKEELISLLKLYAINTKWLHP